MPPQTLYLLWIASAAVMLFSDVGRAEPDQPAHRPTFAVQFQRSDASFCNAPVCVDFDDDGRRELVFASRATGRLEMLDAADGTVRWSKPLAGDQQSIAVFDVDGDGRFEIVYTVSGPGRLYVLDPQGHVLGQWDSDDWKLGHSPLLLDADGDGRLDGYFGTRSQQLVRLDMQTLQPLKRRIPWSQCGCYTSAMDVDGDGRWDLFAGSGDDNQSKGVLHRYDPLTLDTVWSFATNDNASSADAVLADIDGDGRVEIIKSVDNYGGDDAHDAVYAFETDGQMLWKVPGLSGEDSPNVADLDGDGVVEIVGMTFGGEVYCLDSHGKYRWQRDLRPELDDTAHAYMTPILCDLNGDRTLEILALTNGGYFTADSPGPKQANGILFALAADGTVLGQLDLGAPRYWGNAFVCNLDDDPQLELVATGSGGLDVVQLAGYGPATEHFQRRRTYQRLNVLPWAYDETFFIYRGEKQNVVNRTDNLVLAAGPGGYVGQGRFTTEPLRLPPGCHFRRLDYEAVVPESARLTVSLLGEAGQPLLEDVAAGAPLSLAETVRLQFTLSTTDSAVTPALESYSLSFDRIDHCRCQH